jgi:hypothetical protein
MFKIIEGRGFHITFKNGYTVSVQFGPSSYCDHYNLYGYVSNEECGKIGATTAECAVIVDDVLIETPLFDGDTVKGWMTSKEVLKLLNWAESQ